MESFVDFDIKDVGQKMYEELNLDLYKKLKLIQP